MNDGVFYAELNELLTRELAEVGYSGVEVRVTPTRQEIIIRATRTQDVLGEKGRRIRELTALIQKRCVLCAPCLSRFCISLSVWHGGLRAPHVAVTASTSRRVVLSSTPRRLLPAVSAPLLSASRSATSSLAVLPSAGALGPCSYHARI